MTTTLVRQHHRRKPDIPEDIKAAARCVLEFEIMETVEIKGVPILLRNIERALLAERERCAKIIEEGFPRQIVDHYCPHKRLEWEDCDQCAVDAIRGVS